MNRRTKLIILLILGYLLYKYLQKDPVDPVDPPDPENGGWNCTTNYSSTNCDTKQSIGEISGFTGKESTGQKNFINTWAIQNPSAPFDSVKYFVYGKSPKASGYYLQKSDYRKIKNGCVVTEDPYAYPSFYMYHSKVWATGGMANPKTGLNNLAASSYAVDGKQIQNVYPYRSTTPEFTTWKDFIDYLNNNSQFALTTPITYTDTYKRINEILWAEVQFGYSIQLDRKFCECVGKTNCVEL
jgi:hypothetical protein